jgi:hypothetical protein
MKSMPKRSLKPLPPLSLSALSLAVALACLAPSAHALRVGGAEVRSQLGQPLDMVVPFSAEGDPAFQPDCVRVLPGGGDGIPGVGPTRVDVTQRGTEWSARLRTAQPVFEPAVKIVLEVGCAQRARREFVLLLDPPVVAEGSQRALAGAPAELPLVLGEPVIASRRGEALRMRVPVSGRDAAALEANCVAVSTNPGGLGARALVRANRDGATLLISSDAPVDESRLGVSVQAGCDLPVVRDYALLLAAPSLARESGASTGEAAPRPRRRPAVAGEGSAPVARPQAAATAPVATPAAPAPATAERAPAPAAGDRLVLSAPEPAAASTPAAPATESPAAAAPVALPAEREQQILAQLDTLTKEMQSLRAELAAAQARNLELQKAQVFAQQQNAAATPPYAWIFAGVAALALGFGLLLAWRSRKTAEGGWEEENPVGPATRLGVSQEVERRGWTAPAAAAPLPTAPRADGVTEKSAAAVAAAWAAASVAEPATAAAARGGVPTSLDTSSAPEREAIEVTEFANTGQLIQDLYTPFLASGQKPAAVSEAEAAPLPTPPIPSAPEPVAAALDGAGRAAANAPHRVDVNLDAMTELLAEQKTQIAVDLDVGTQALPTQLLDDWDQTLFQPPRDEASKTAAPGAPLTPLDFELKFDAPESPKRGKS